MNSIPHIIHQIWSGIDEPLPHLFQQFGQSWKEFHPAWKYELWDNKRMNQFVLTNYPQYWDAYCRFPYNIQRWDAIRYLILDKLGGLYVDFDTECLQPLDELIDGKQCCFSVEPRAHAVMHGKELFFNNALMAAVPEHPFFKTILKHVFQHPSRLVSPNSIGERAMEIQTSTGPLFLVDLYEKYTDKGSIYLIPAKYVSPYSASEIELIKKGVQSRELISKLKEAYSIHYFFNGWVYDKK